MHVTCDEYDADHGAVNQYVIDKLEKDYEIETDETILLNKMRKHDIIK